MISRQNLELHCREVKYTKDGGFDCLCNCHDDHNPSFHWKMGRVGWIGNCKTCGAKGIDFAKVEGINATELFIDTGARSPNWKAYIESREKRKIEAVYNYVSSNGGYAFTKIRLEGKKLLYGILENERFTYGLPRDTPRKSLKAIYGNIRALNKAITEGKPIFIPEGEKDVDTLTKQGYTAFTYGGVNDWQADFAELVKGADVIILADNDSPGKAVADAILRDIQPVAKSAKIIVPMPDIPKADISDYFNAEHTKEEFEQMINSVTENRKSDITDTATDKSLIEILPKMKK